MAAVTFVRVLLVLFSVVVAYVLCAMALLWARYGFEPAPILAAMLVVTAWYFVNLPAARRKERERRQALGLPEHDGISIAKLLMCQ